MGNNKTILIATDHNGNTHRKYLVENLLFLGYNVIDMGPYDVNMKVDYTLYADNLCNAICSNHKLLGILICGTGIGMSIAANRWASVRASLVHDIDEAKKTREHNNSNLIVFGAWRSTSEEMLEMTLAWLNEDFGKGRHEQRVAKLSDEKHDIVAVPGVFDIVHPGHMKLFRFAESFGNVVVLLNSDKSTRTVKGRDPFFPYEWRYDVVKNIDCVDEVIMLSGTPGRLAKEIGATLYVKGDIGLSEDSVKEMDEVDDNCEIKLFPLICNASSAIIRSKLK